jgi:hypothetical protein
MAHIEDGVGARYDCPFELAGTAYTYAGAANSVTMSYFTDSSSQNNDTDSGSMSNPYFVRCPSRPESGFSLSVTRELKVPPAKLTPMGLLIRLPGFVMNIGGQYVVVEGAIYRL